MTPPSDTPKRRARPGSRALTGPAGVASLIAAALLGPVSDAQAEEVQPPAPTEAGVDPCAAVDPATGQPAAPECEVVEEEAPAPAADPAEAIASAPTFEEGEAQADVASAEVTAVETKPASDADATAHNTQTGVHKPRGGDGESGGGDGGHGTDGGEGDPGHGSPQGEGNQATGSAPGPEDWATSGGHFGPAPVTTAKSPIPSFLLPIYLDCGREYGVPWRVLAAINQVETAFGSNLNVSSAGAQGWMQFMPATWAAYGVDADGNGKRDPYDPEDAICSAANYLEASGARTDLRGAIFAYNHADWYVEMVLSAARSFADVSVIDPLPRAKRLDTDFARELATVSRANEVDWALVLAVVRAGGGKGPNPATDGEVRDIAKDIAGGERFKTSETQALARFNRAVGIRGLVHGLNAVRDRLAQRALDSKVLELYEGGRDDVKAGRIDPRLLTLLLYLAERHEEITVTSLISGHGYYARPGVPSAHVFGEAVDIASIDGTPVMGNQQPGSIVERTVREILDLPSELQAEQVISLYEFGGPSFAAADHDDHIHVGF